MNIASAGGGHAEEWLEMRLLLWPECAGDESAQEIARIIGSNREAAFLALDDEGAAIGFAEVSTREYVDGCRSAPVGYLEGIFVRPEHRRKGVGAALVRATEAWSRSMGCTEMGSDTRIGDNRSIGFHRSLGFGETDRQVVFLKAIG